MVRTIHIENYKSITTLDLELGRVNVLIGANGSGKTNLLEAIVLGSAAAAGKLDNEFLATRGVRVVNGESMKSGFDKITMGLPIKLLFTKDESVIPILFIDRFDGEIEFHVEIDNPNKIESIKELFQDTELEELASDFVAPVIILMAAISQIRTQIKTEVQDTRNNINDFLEEGIIKKFIFSILSKRSNLHTFLLYAPENHFLRRFEEEAQIRPLGIRGEGLFSHLAELYREKPEQFQKIVAEVQELTDWVDNIEIPNDLIFTERRLRISDRYLQEGLAFIDQRSSNEGFLYLLFYITLLVSDRTPKFFAIDNVDNALNPKLCRKLMEVISRLAVEHDKQVILTAHNPGLLDGLNINDPEQRLFVLSRNADGHTKALRLDKKPSANGNGQVRLSEQFLRGYIGGLPDDF